MTKVLSVERLTLTQQDIDDHPYKTKKPWCKLCSRKQPLAFRRDVLYGPVMTRFKWIPTFIKPGERVVKVIYENHTVAYYHKSCFQDPENKEEVDKILKTTSI